MCEPVALATDFSRIFRDNWLGHKTDNNTINAIAMNTEQLKSAAFPWLYMDESQFLHKYLII